MIPARQALEPHSEIIDDCTGCNLCVSECPLLQRIGDPLSLAQRGVTVTEAYSCSLCGLCDAVCPESLRVKDIFANT